jgi:polyribonucleotide nucleotidyltransferase
MEKTSKSVDLSGKLLTLETGKIASQATSAVLGRLGDTMVLVTVVEGGKREDIDYFPLTVEYIERLYAGGRIKGSRWVKREGRPSDDSILIARLIDRSIRPLFPKEYKKEVQIVVTVLSVDGENEPDVLSIITTSAALAISRIPWKGPISATRVGFVKEKTNGKGEFLMNPGPGEAEFSELDLVVTQSKEKTLMIEAGALQATEDVVLQSIEKAGDQNKKVIEFIEELVKEIGQEKEKVFEDSKFSELIKRLEKTHKSEILDLIEMRASNESSSGSTELIDKIFEDEKTLHAEEQIDKKLIAKAVEKILFQGIRDNILKNNKRPDGRGLDQIREISSSVSMLPRTHGSAIFQRGQTQALTVVTLASPKLEQLIESAEGEEVKRYIHHYSMPPYSVGETGRMGTPSRREIGHGALAERALLAVIPKQDVFPYTIRVVSEILSSNGSTSMAATCGSTLALMDAGVPIKKPVGGIAMGMVSKDDKYVLLTDILGLEDFSGDMDFKVAGTDEGITAIQLDVKVDGLTLDQIKETLEKAKSARLIVLSKMLEVMPESREQVSRYAPKIEVLHIPLDKIGELIGPGGRTIKNIIAQTGATVDVEDDGTVAVSGTSEESVQKAFEWIKNLTREVVAGETFEGEVKRILPFGAFVEILPGKEGMVHVSKMSKGFVKDPSNVVKIGEKVKVKVIEIDEQGRLNLSMLVDGQEKEGDTQENLPKPKSEHPLALQFKREREAEWRKKRPAPSRNFRKSY